MKENNMDNVLLDPKRVFNFDETAFYLHPKKNLLSQKKGSKNVYCVRTGSDKECTTVLLGVNASGNPPPPLIIYKYERIPRHIAINMP